MNMHQQGGVTNDGVRPNAGVNVSKLHLDVCVGTTQQRVPNDVNGWSELTAMFQAVNTDLVVLEGHGWL